MKKFSEFNEEASDEDNTKKSVLNLIATSLNRQASSTSDKDTRSILMLIAALGMLNAKDDTGLSLSTARRLAAGSSIKSNK